MQKGHITQEQGCCKKPDPKKAHLKKTIKPTKKPTFNFFFEKIYEVKNKIGRTLVQLTLTFF